MKKSELRNIIKEELKEAMDRDWFGDKNEKQSIGITVHLVDDITGKPYDSKHNEHDMNRKEFDDFVKKLKQNKNIKIKGADWLKAQIEYSK